jgi:hypothetical protein
VLLSDLLETVVVTEKREISSFFAVYFCLLGFGSEIFACWVSDPKQWGFFRYGTLSEIGRVKYCMLKKDFPALFTENS